ncbi:MAG: serine/threonine protein kinase [Planctomycetes bacterium]|nr:serine/threonine protein kinase [Planctomycetota bacterium]
MPAPDPRLAAIFDGALAVDPAQREAWLALACGGDAALAREVLELLRQAQREDPALLGAAAALRDLADRTWLVPLARGRQLGGFVVQEVLATGGMGTVYLAEQQEPHRRVALKVLSAHLEGGELERRFRHESSILAHLRHPGIAQVYATGVHAGDGRNMPWFALEFVAGARWITQYARERQLPVAARAALFAQVCDAVHYGHCKGIVHRDLKPANLLVDAEGRPKVIDFGVAKVTGADLGDSMATLAGQLVGTVGYMSPEQAQGEPAAVDTRSDVYSLGVVLYELLAGRLPYPVQDKSLAAAARTVCEVEPDRAPLLPLPADLRTIVLTALAKDPGRRYGSAEALALDLGRYLRNEPIAAREPSPWYVFARFVRRNRLLSATAAALLLALLLGGLGTLRGLLRAERAEAAARWGRDFLVAMLYDADPWLGRGPQVGLGDALRGAVARLEQDPPAPAIEADMRAVLGEVLARIGEPGTAVPQLRRAIALLRDQGEAEAQRAARLELGLLLCLVDLGRIDEAAAMAAPLRRQYHEREAPGSPDWLRIENVTGRILAARGDHAAAAEVLQAAIAAADALPQCDTVQRETLRNNAALALRALGRLDEAEAMLRQVLSFRCAAFGDAHPETLFARGNLAAVLVERGKLAAARAEFVATRAVQAEKLGETDRRTLTTDHNLALLERRLGNLNEAERLGRTVLDARRTVLGGDAAETLVTQANLASALVNLAEREPARRRQLLAEAEELLRDAIARRERTETAPTADRATAHGTLGALLLVTDRAAAAEPQLAAACRIAAATFDPARPEPWVFRAGLAAARAAQGRAAEVLPELELCRRELLQRVGEAHDAYQGVLVWCRRFGGGR